MVAVQGDQVAFQAVLALVQVACVREDLASALVVPAWVLVGEGQSQDHVGASAFEVLKKEIKKVRKYS